MRVTRRAALRSLAGAGLVAAGAAAYGFAYERRHFAVSRTVISLAALPPDLAGLRLGFISDIHCGDFMPAALVAQAAALLMAERPDLILLGGDFVTWKNRRQVEPCVEALSGLAARLGVFAVLGNHDPDSMLPQAFRRPGVVEVLADRSANLRVKGATLTLGGVDYWSQRADDLVRTFAGSRGFRILLAHDPRRLEQAADIGVPLVLSGHTHGGQVVLPLLGAPAAWRFPVVHGLGRDGSSQVYVTRGLGTTTFPVRLGCAPEISILTLEAA
jgi:uncharacterized protein